MSEKRNFTLDIVSGIDEDVIDKQLHKRASLWKYIIRGKRRKLISLIAAACCFCIIITSVVIINPFGKEVPVYRGMTVSMAAPVIEENTSLRSGEDFGGGAVFVGTLSMTPFMALDKSSSYTADQTKENKKDDLDLSAEESYYAKKNEDIYILVHISNPDGFEILSFTLNGVKYSSYMFEEGSNLETLVLKYNVGDVEGIQQYTIDAIKYVDGEKIKDVRMDGDRTIEVLVEHEYGALSLSPSFDGLELVISPEWAEDFTGEKKITSICIYEDGKLIREVEPTSKKLGQIALNKRLLLVVTYVDNGETVSSSAVLQTPCQNEGLTVINGIITDIGHCKDTVLYLDMPVADYAFEGANITEVYLSEGVTSIGNSVFVSCSLLEKVVLPNAIQHIPGGVFLGCGSLKEIVLPESVVSLGQNFAGQCASLERIYINSKELDKPEFGTITPPTGGKGYVFGNLFGDCPKLTHVYFAGTQEAWNSALGHVRYWELSGNVTVVCSDGEIVIKPGWK